MFEPEPDYEDLPPHRPNPHNYMMYMYRSYPEPPQELPGSIPAIVPEEEEEPEPDYDDSLSSVSSGYECLRGNSMM